MFGLLELFSHVDDFCQVFLPTGNITSSRYRDFKAFSQDSVYQHWKSEFPSVVSYNRFIEFIPAVLVALYIDSLFDPSLRFRPRISDQIKQPQ